MLSNVVNDHESISISAYNYDLWYWFEFIIDLILPTDIVQYDSNLPYVTQFFTILCEHHCDTYHSSGRCGREHHLIAAAAAAAAAAADATPAPANEEEEEEEDLRVNCRQFLFL